LLQLQFGLTLLSATNFLRRVYTNGTILPRRIFG
jgi:hypothetical protein